MKNFKLRILDDKKSGMIIPDSRHSYGGTDLVQLYAFRHLFPSGECPWPMRSLLYSLAEAHGWEVSVEVREI